MIPRPGEAAGWVVCFGKGYAHRCYIAEDRARAEKAAAELHGIIVPVIAAPEQPPARGGLSAQPDAPGATPSA